jgi:hypothetical protein
MEEAQAREIEREKVRQETKKRVEAYRELQDRA